MKRISFAISTKSHEFLQDIANSDDRSLSSLCRVALHHYIKTEAKNQEDKTNEERGTQQVSG